MGISGTDSKSSRNESYFLLCGDQCNEQGLNITVSEFSHGECQNSEKRKRTAEVRNFMLNSDTRNGLALHTIVVCVFIRRMYVMRGNFYV